MIECQLTIRLRARVFYEQKTRASSLIVAFVKERFHNAVEIDILGIFEGYSSLQILAPQKNFSGAKLFRANNVISIEHVFCS